MIKKILIFSAVLSFVILLSACQPVSTPTALLTKTPTPGILPQTTTGKAIPLNTALPTKTTTPTNQPYATLTAGKDASGPLNSIHLCSDEQGWAIGLNLYCEPKMGGNPGQMLHRRGLKRLRRLFLRPHPRVSTRLS